jgi:hypothetical protein
MKRCRCWDSAEVCQQPVPGRTPQQLDTLAVEALRPEAATQATGNQPIAV